MSARVRILAPKLTEFRAKQKNGWFFALDWFADRARHLLGRMGRIETVEEIFACVESSALLVLPEQPPSQDSQRPPVSTSVQFPINFSAKKFNKTQIHTHHRMTDSKKQMFYRLFTSQQQHFLIILLLSMVVTSSHSILPSIIRCKATRQCFGISHII